MNKIFKSSVLAGLMIGIGSISYLANPSIFGCMLFSVGLLAILDCQLTLFTGKVPYMKSYKELPYILTVLAGNTLGCLVLVAFPSDVARNIIIKMLEVPIWTILIESMICNILIYVAVESYKKNNILSTILCVIVFVATGFRHSIATICMMVSARMFDFTILWYLCVIIVGNGLGGILFHRIRVGCEK